MSEPTAHDGQELLIAREKKPRWMTAQEPPTFASKLEEATAFAPDIAAQILQREGALGNKLTAVGVAYRDFVQEAQTAGRELHWLTRGPVEVGVHTRARKRLLFKIETVAGEGGEPDKEVLSGSMVPEDAADTELEFASRQEAREAASRYWLSFTQDTKPRAAAKTAKKKTANQRPAQS